MSKQCHTLRHAPVREFQLRTGDRRVGRYFLARLPPEVDQREALLLVCSSTGMEVARKSLQLKLPAARCSDDGLASVRLHEDCSTTGV